jgi:tellurite resistance protein TehA-like permease
MSDITIILVTLPIFMFEYFVSVWTLRWINLRGDAIETGAVQGLPLSREARWIKLFHEWAPLLFSQCAFLLIVALGWISLAQEIGDPSVRALVYAYAFLSGVASLGFAVFGTQNVFRMISMLRRVEED